MLPLLAILSTILLLGGFVALTQYEMARGSRYFAHERSRLDRDIARVNFVIEHVDFAAFLREEIRHLARRVAHDSVHLTLQSVRAVERLLTRVVRSFRMREELHAAPRVSTRAFVRTLTDFKEQLKTTAPEISPEIR